VLAWVLLGEHLSAPQLIGGFTVLAGAFIAQSAAPKPPSGPVAAGGGAAAAATEGELSAGRASH
ncbi:EamA family transporter, partial [Streptomyces sp. SID8455]|nr:EamA family transporter [Streptomyces sp. SID8455]